MPTSKNSSKSDRKEDSGKTSKRGKYMRTVPVSPNVAGYYQSSIVTRHPTTVKRSDSGNSARDRNARSLSVPSLHSTVESRSKYSPPLSPPKQRSRSVRDRDQAKKTNSFRKAIKQMFGSHSDLENGTSKWPIEQQAVGTYRPLNFSRPKSMGEASDCSNSSDLSRGNSLRDSSRSRIQYKERDSVFHLVGRQPSADSNDYNPCHAATGSSDSNLRPISVTHLPRSEMSRSTSSASLKNFGVQTKILVPDSRHFSIAAIPLHSAHPEGIPFIEDRSFPHRGKPTRHLHRQSDDNESLWEDSASFQFVNNPVLPSDPEYKQVAHELMSASPHRRGDMSVDPRRMSDTGLDPRRVSADSGVESLSTTKHNRSLPSTPITTTILSNTNGGTSSPELRPSTPHTPHSCLSQESTASILSGHETNYKHRTNPPDFRPLQSPHWKVPPEEPEEESIDLPPGWELVKSTKYGTYYVNHNNKTAMYQHPYHARPPPSYHRPHNYADEEPRQSRAERRVPARSHSHRSTQSHRVLDSNASLPRRSKSFRDPEMAVGESEDVSHERQLSTMTFVPPSPYQIKEIPDWIRGYVEQPFGSEIALKMQSQWRLHSPEELTEVDTMIKRLFKKGSEQIVRKYEYYRVALQQEIDERARQRMRQGLGNPQLSQSQNQLLPQGHTLNEPYSPRPVQSFRLPSPPPVDNPPQRHQFHTSPPPEAVPHPHGYPSSLYDRAEPDIHGYHATHSLLNPHHTPHTPHTPHYPHNDYQLNNSTLSLTSNTSNPTRAQSCNYLPRVNSQTKMSSKPEAGFQDIFGYSTQNGTINSLKTCLSNTEFHGLEETFV